MKASFYRKGLKYNVLFATAVYHHLGWHGWVLGGYGSRGPFLESPGNLTGPKSYFEIRVSRKVRCTFTSNEVHFVSLADNLNV